MGRQINYFVLPVEFPDLVATVGRPEPVELVPQEQSSKTMRPGLPTIRHRYPRGSFDERTRLGCSLKSPGGGTRANHGSFQPAPSGWKWAVASLMEERSQKPAFTSTPCHQLIRRSKPGRDEQ